MGKTNDENLDLKSKLNVVSGIIANAKKDIESIKTDNLITIGYDILMTKSEFILILKVDIMLLKMIY